MNLISTILLVALLSVAPTLATRRIKGNVVVKEFGQSKTALVYGVCKDEDPLGPDDTMASGQIFGSFDFEYKKKTGKFCTWDCGTETLRRPDIYCTFTGEGYNTFRTGIHSNFPQQNNLDFGTITMYPIRYFAGGACLTRGTYGGCGSGSTADLIPEHEFWGSCNNHDCCYNTCGETQSDCDNEFYANMKSICREVYRNKQITLCNERAWLYYQEVSNLGSIAYETAQLGCPWRTLQQSNSTAAEEERAMLPERLADDDGYDDEYFAERNEEMALVVLSVAVAVLALVAGAVVLVLYRRRSAIEEENNKESDATVVEMDIHKDSSMT